MAVIINEIEVLEQPAPAPNQQAPHQASSAPADLAEAVLRLVRDSEQRQRRLVAD